MTRAQITPQLVAEAKQQAELKIDTILRRCRSNQTGSYEDCTCPRPMPDENQLIAEHLNFALIIMEKR